MNFFESIEKGIKAVSGKIKKIRRSDERTKRNWLIGSTVIMMIVVITLWVGYLNLTLPGIAPSETSTSTVVTQVQETDKSDSVFSVFARGFRITIKSISKNFSGTTGKISDLIFRTKQRLKNVQEYIPDNLSN